MKQSINLLLKVGMAQTQLFTLSQSIYFTNLAGNKTQQKLDHFLLN